MTLDNPDYGLIGVSVLTVSAVVIVIEATLAAVWAWRLTRHATTLNERLSAQRAQVQQDVERLRAALAETEVLWEPYRGLLRWLQHPLMIALLQSFMRRLAVAR